MRRRKSQPLLSEERTPVGTQVDTDNYLPSIVLHTGIEAGAGTVNPVGHEGQPGKGSWGLKSCLSAQVEISQLEPRKEVFSRQRNHIQMNGLVSALFTKQGLGEGVLRGVVSSEGRGAEGSRGLPSPGLLCWTEALDLVQGW